MTFDNLNNYNRGWFIGNFNPSLVKTKDFEISIQTHPKGFIGDKHFHTKSIEYNVVIQGKVKICGVEMNKDDIFIFNPTEISESEFLENTILLIVRMPSEPNDKIIM